MPKRSIYIFKKPLRKCHFSARLQWDLNNGGALYVHLLAGSGVAPRHSACLVEAVRFDSACIVCYKYLKHNWLIHTLQLGTKTKQIVNK